MIPSSIQLGMKSTLRERGIRMLVLVSYGAEVNIDKYELSLRNYLRFASKATLPRAEGSFVNFRGRDTLRCSSLVRTCRSTSLRLHLFLPTQIRCGCVWNLCHSWKTSPPEGRVIPACRPVHQSAGESPSPIGRDEACPHDLYPHENFAGKASW